MGWRNPRQRVRFLSQRGCGCVRRSPAGAGLLRVPGGPRMTDSQSLRQCAAILLSNNRDASYTIACAVRDAREIAHTYAAAIRANMLTYSIWPGNYAIVIPGQIEYVSMLARM